MTASPQTPLLDTVDTPEDLAALSAALTRLPGRAPRTRAVLDRLSPAGLPTSA